MTQDKGVVSSLDETSESGKSPGSCEVSSNTNAAKSSTRSEERRRHPRHRVGVLTEIEYKGKDKIPGITFNVSESGALLLTLETFEPGEEVRLDFISADGQRDTVRGRVVHGRELDENVFWSQGIGIEFVSGVPKFFEVSFLGQDSGDD